MVHAMFETLKTVAAGAAFYDHLEVHKGLSLGAQITLAIPDIQLLPQHEKEWAAQYGVRDDCTNLGGTGGSRGDFGLCQEGIGESRFDIEVEHSCELRQCREC